MTDFKILLVEDELNIVSTLLRALKREFGEGVEIAACATAEDALLLLNSEIFDLVITDHQLPGISGLNLITQLSLMPLSPKVILMTAVPLAIETDEYSNAIMTCLIKPFRLSVLINQIYKLYQPAWVKEQ